MAITTQFLTGFEHGFIGAGASPGGGLVTTVNGTGFSASSTSPRNGAYCAHCVAPASTLTRLTWSLTSTGKLLARFGLKIPSRPGQVVYLAGATQAGTHAFSLRVDVFGNLTLIGTNSTTGPTGIDANWHLIELQWDGTAKTIDWKVDGVLQPRAASVATIATIDAFYFGNLANDAAYTADYDDLILGTWTNAATDWYGDGKVLAQRAGLDGTHATITSLSPGDAGTAYSGTPTTVNTMVDDAPATGGWTATRDAVDNIALRVATVAAYAEIKPSATAEVGAANAVRAIMSYSSSTTTANLAACDVRNSAGAVIELWGLTGGVGKAYNVTANNFKGAIVTQPAAGWTAAEINAIRLRFGGCVSADISPVPTVQAMMLEVDWPYTYGPPPSDETPIDDFNRANGPVYSGAGASIWEDVGGLFNNTDPCPVITASNQMATTANGYARSKLQLQSDFDLLYDVLVPPVVNMPPVYFALTDLGTTVVDGLQLSIAGPGGGVGVWSWRFWNYTNGAGTANSPIATGPPPQVGSTIWIARRGSVITAYFRYSASSRFDQIVTATDSRSAVSGPFAINIQDTSIRLDNLRGGPLVATGVTYNDTGSGTIAASGSVTEDYSHDASVSGTITASGSGIESYSTPVIYDDSASGTITSSGTGTDNRIYDDSVSGAITSSGSGVESYIYIDSRSGAVTASGTGTESYSYFDSGSGTITASGSGVESYQATYIDISSGTVIANGTRVESYSYADNASGTVTASGIGTESYIYTDSRSATVTASGIGTEAYSYVDSGSGTVTTNGSGIESYQIVYVDSGSGTLIANGSGTESYQIAYIDSASGTVTASGSGTESYQVASAYTDSGSGTVTASGSGVESYQPTYADIASGTVIASGVGTESYSNIDSGLGTITSSGARAEFSSYADSGSGTVNASGTGVDARVYPDTSTGTIAATGTGSDDRVYADTSVGTIVATGIGSDAGAYADTSVGTIAATGTGSDGVVHVGSGTGTILISGTGVESSDVLIGYIDARSGQVNASGAGVESQSHSSTATGSVVVNGTTVESQLRSSTATGSLSAGGTSVESQSHSNTATGSVFVDGTASETHSVSTIYTDTSEGVITSTGIGVDSVSYSNTAIGTITSIGTSADTVFYNNTETGTITLLGSGVESYSYIDASTGIIVVKGIGYEKGTRTQPVPVSTIVALNRVNVAVRNKSPIHSVVTSTTPLMVQIALQRTIKVYVVKRNEMKVLVRNR